MAKRLEVLDVAATAEGAVVRLGRLGERFEWHVETARLGALVQLFLRALATKAAALRATPQTIVFSDETDRPGLPPPLVFDTGSGIIALDLSWAQVSALSQLATGMLSHAPTPDRSN